MAERESAYRTVEEWEKAYAELYDRVEQGVSPQIKKYLDAARVRDQQRLAEMRAKKKQTPKK
jgi:hypothetical protein